MKLAPAKVAENRERVLATALRLFRERGFDAVSVGDLMREAGLTHGGFYNHFASKADLEAQACARAFAGSKEALAAATAVPAGPGRRYGLAGYITRYLSRSWRDAPAVHCPMVAFSTDAGRSRNEVTAAYAAGASDYLEELTKLVDATDAGGSKARGEAITLAATLIGALTLARGVNASDPALSDEILTTVRDSLLNATLED